MQTDPGEHESAGPYDVDEGDVSSSAMGDELVSAERIRIVCHGCGAHYHVRANKVQGRRFRATCKKCGAIIVVEAQEPAGEATEETPSPGHEEDGAFSRPLHLTGDDLRQDDEVIWYVVIAGKPHGPISAAQVHDSFAAGRIGLRSYLWKAGDAEWRRLADIPEFADLSERETAFFQVGQSTLSRPGTEETLAAIPRRMQEWAGEAAPRAGDLASALDSEGGEPNPEEHTTLFGEGRLSPLEPLDGEPTRYVVRSPTSGSEGMAAGLAQLAATVAAQQGGAVPPEELTRPRDEGGGAVPTGGWAQVPLIPPRRAVLPPPNGVVRPAPAAAPLAPSLEQPLPGVAVERTRPVSDAERAKLFTAEPVRMPTGAVEPPRLAPAPAPPPAPPVPVLPVRNVFEDSLRPIGPPVPGPALLAPAPEPFWTSGRIAAAAAVAGGLSVAVAVIVVVSLVRPNPSAMQHVAAVPLATPVAAPVVPAQPAVAAQVPQPAPGAPLTGQANRPVVAAPTAVVPAAVAPTPAAPAHDPAAAEADQIPISVKSSEPLRPAARRTSAAAAGKEARRKPARGKGRSRASGEDGVSSSEVDQLLGRGAPAKSSEVDADSLLAAGSGEKRRTAAPARKAAASDADALLAAGSGAAAPTAEAARGDRPSKEQIRTAIQGVMPAVRACRNQYSATGVLRMQITLRGSGGVEARPLGEFADTPAGFCFAGALQKAKFPTFTGPPLSFQYPFSL